MDDVVRADARVVSRIDAAEGVVSLVLESADPATPLPDWQPGAHVDVGCGEGIERQYSLCGPAEDRGRWRIGVLLAPASRGGSKWVHERVGVGDVLTVRGPRNTFVFEPGIETVFFAGGIGITPLLPMIRAAQARGADWRLVYGGRRRASMAFLDELEEFGPKVTVAPEDEAGFIDFTAVLGDTLPGRRVYACGPEPMLTAIEKVMELRDGESLHLERFAPKEPIDTGGDAFDVQVASSGDTVRVEEGESIIDALGRIGVTVDYSCREGTCGTCITDVVSGIPDHRDSILTDEEHAVNDCMTVCVSRCKVGPLVLKL